MSEKTRFRCAIYTRKSSDEGLDQDFNSIEAQREAGEAYVRSQAHEGWSMIPDRFDDGGFSGGNMARPALARLMELIEDGQIDVIVIYKIDRLTRSLTDFARLAEIFDKYKVSFVSVTQQFNTTNSMGRLMLNVLLSFAQFEREITGERIRDKIAASKKKGMWMGGPVPMGYAISDRRLVIEPDEARTVRAIFERYLDAGGVPSLLERLAADGIKTPARLSAKGRSTGQRYFTRGHLYKLLSNPIYIGRVQHKTTTHPGQHPAIIDKATWAAVQSQLATNTQGPRKRRRRAEASPHLLADLLVAGNGKSFVPTHANKGARRYRYYVEDAPTDARARRLPAQEIESAVIAALAAYLSDHRQLAQDLEVHGTSLEPMLLKTRSVVEQIAVNREQTRQLLRRLLTKAVYRDAEVELHIVRDHLKVALGWRDAFETALATNRQPVDDVVVVTAPLSIRRRGPQLKLTLAGAAQGNALPDQSLLTAVVRARNWADRIMSGSSLTTIATQEQVTDGYVSQLLPLAFLAPSLVEAILDGRHPAGLTADRLIWKTQLPLSWREQVLVLS